MPAQKQYSSTEFVDGAMRLFWSRGYEGTSMNDLVRSTGINRGSIYANFDGKRGIFVAALGRYDELYRERFLKALERDNTPKGSIIAAFKAAADAGSDPTLPKGCLVVNTAIELSPHDPEVAALVDASLGALHRFFLTQLATAQQAGEIPAGLDVASTATTLFALFLGLRVMCRSNTATATTDAVVQKAGQLLG